MVSDAGGDIVHIDKEEEYYSQAEDNLENKALKLLYELHRLVSDEPLVEEVLEILDQGGDLLKEIIDVFPDDDKIDGDRRNLLHVTLRDVVDDYLAEEMCLIFLRAGASGINCNRDITQRTATDYALSRGLCRLWAILQREPADQDFDKAFEELRKEKVSHFSDLLRNAIKENKIDEIETYLNQGADPNMPNKNGFSSLHFAAVKTKPASKFEVLKKLITKGADVNYQDKEGNTALQLLLKRVKEGSCCDDAAGDVETISYLMQAGTDVSLKDSDGKDSMAIVKEKQRQDLTQIMKSKPAIIKQIQCKPVEKAVDVPKKPAIDKVQKSNTPEPKVKQDITKDVVDESSKPQNNNVEKQSSESPAIEHINTESSCCIIQ